MSRSEHAHGWHDTPGDQPIALPIEMQQGVFHRRCDARLAKPAGTVAGVLVPRDELVQLDFPWVGSGEILDPCQLNLPGLDNGVGDGVVQAKSEGLQEAGLIEVGKVASGAPRVQGWR